MKTILVALTISLLSSLTVTAQKPYYNEENTNWQKDSLEGNVGHTVYLIGDAGEVNTEKPSALDILGAHLASEHENSTVLFLGDNSYPTGVPEQNSSKRNHAEKSLQVQFNSVDGFNGAVYFIPGNHDWDRWSKNGWEGVKREEKYIEKNLNRNNSFLPDLGCPGPVQVELTENVLLIIIDTQWWLHKWDKPNVEKDSCGVNDEIEFINKLSEIVRDNNDKNIIVAAHHPLYSNGNHGGYVALKDHIFPLTTVKPNLYIPLPVLGSIYPFYRKYIGYIQDLSHPRYQLLKSNLLDAFKGHPHLVYAAGHEHNLQYSNVNNQHHIVSGSGSKTRFVAKGRGAAFTYAKHGFSKVIYLESGEVWTEFWATSGANNAKGELVFRKKLTGVKKKSF